MRRCTHGFTLIELLVVIAIIAVLAALAFSGAQSWLVSADKGKSTANLRAIVAAMNSDAGDNNGWITLHGGGWNWDFYNSYLVRKYQLPKKMFSAPSIKPQHDARWEKDEGNLFSACGYGVRFLKGWEGHWNALRSPGGAVNSPGAMWGLKYAHPILLNPYAITNPSKFWILGENLDADQGFQKIYMSGDPGDQWEGRFHLRYGGSALAAFLDGHVELCNRERLKEMGVKKVINEKGVEETLK